MECAVGKCFVKIHQRPGSPHPIEVSAVTLSTLSAVRTHSPRSRAGVTPSSAAGTRRRRQVPGSARLSYPLCVLSVRPCVTRRARGRQPSGWRWPLLSRSKAVAAPRAAASRWPPRSASAPAPSPPSPPPRASACWAPPPRRVLVYVGALALVALASYASIAWSLTPQTSYGDANRWLVAAAAAAGGALLAGLLRRPLEGAVWVLCAASLPLVAYAIQQRADGVFFQTSPRLQGVLGYPNAIGAYAALAAPAALWLASSPQRARRVAGCGTLALLVLGLALASSRGGMLAAVLGCAAWLAVSERRTETGAAAAGGARRERPGRSLGRRPAAPSRRSTRPSPCPPAIGLIWYSAAAVVAAAIARPARRRARAARGRARAPHLRPGRRRRRSCSEPWPRPSSSPRRTAGRAARSATSGTSSPAAAPSARPTTSTRSRRTSAAAGGARPGTASPRTRCRATAPTRSRRSTASRGPTSSRPARSTRSSSTCSRASGCWARSRRRSRSAPPAPAWRRSRACAAASAPPRSRSSAGVGAFALHNQIDWEWKQTALTLLAYPIPVLIACAAGGGAVVARPPRRGARRRGRGRVRARHHPGDAPRAEQPRARPRRPPRGAGPPRRGARRGRPRRRARPHVGRRPARARQPAAGARPPARRAPRRRPRARRSRPRTPRSG